MGSRVAILIAMLIILSSLAQPIASSGDSESELINAPPTPLEGIFVIDSDWVISSYHGYLNSIIYLTGNLTIESSGGLNLKNSSLVMNLNKDGQFHVDIMGTLTMNDIDNNPMTETDMSQIYSNNSAKNYAIKAYAGSLLVLYNSQISHHGFMSNSKGLVVDTDFATIDGMRFVDGYYGISVQSDGAIIQNSWFIDNRYGVEFYRSEPVFDNNIISGSSYRGIYIYQAKPFITNCNIHNNTIGIYEWYSEATIISTKIVDSSITGLESYYSTSLVQDSELSNNRDINAVRESFPRLLNTTLDESSVVLGFGLFISVGYYTDVQVTALNGTGMANHVVSILDQENNPASNGITNETGWAMNLGYYDRFLTEFGSLVMGQHNVMAFEKNEENISFGSNITTLGPGDQCNVEVEINPPNIHIWDAGKVISTQESYHNQQIIALGDVSLDLGSLLILNNTHLMFLAGSDSIELDVISNNFNSYNSSIGSMGVSRILKPGTLQVTFEETAEIIIDNTTFSWTDKIEIQTDLALIKNSNILHSKETGLMVSECQPTINNLYVNWTPRGLYLRNDMSRLTNITVENARDYGIQCSVSGSRIDSLTASGTPKAIYSYSSEAWVNNLQASGCDYGLYAYDSIIELHNSSIAESSYYGAYWQASEGTINNTYFIDSDTGIGLSGSSLLVDSSFLNGNDLGLEAILSSPVLLNTSFSNLLDISAGRASHVSAVNCSLNNSRVEVEPSGNVDIGSWIHILVKDETTKPIQGCNVTILDSQDNVASSAITDSDGIARFMAFRNSRIYWNRTENYTTHNIMAFRPDTDVQGMNSTALEANSTADVTASTGAMGWIHWEEYTILNTQEHYENETIIMHDNMIIDTDGRLTLENCTVWFFGGKYSYQYIYAKKEFLGIYNTTMRPISMSAPLQPYRSFIQYDASASGKIVDSHFSGLKQIISFSNDFTMSGTKIDGAAISGIGLSGGKPKIENCTLNFNNDGIVTYQSPLELYNVSITESGQYGLYTEGGELDIKNTDSSYAKYGFYALEDAAGTLDQCSARENTDGLVILDSAPEIIGFSAINNTNCGIRTSESHSKMADIELMNNYQGLYLYKSWPDIMNSTINDNYYGVYAYKSGTYIEDSHLEGNDIGFYEYGSYSNSQDSPLSPGISQDSAVFIDGGIDQHISMKLPARAEIISANISITGDNIGVDAIFQDSEQQRSPDIYGDRVVWEDRRTGNWEIYSYDLSMDSDMDNVPNYLETPPLENDPAMFRITNNSKTQGEPQIYEDTVVWTDMRNDEYDIYAYTFSNDTLWPVCTDAGIQRSPAIYDDKIIWDDYRNGNYDIFMLNISTGEQSQLSTSTRHDMASSIHGDYVAWYSYSGSPASESSDIVMFNLKTWTMTPITKDSPIQYRPDVYGDNIVWHESGPGIWELYKYEISTGTIERLTYEGQQSFCPDIYQDKVVYYYYHNILDCWSVLMVNITTGENTILERETFGDARPVIHGSKIAWVNRTQNDIHVLDLAHDSYPENSSVDIGIDGENEFQWNGILEHTEYINETALMDSLNKQVNKESGGMVSIPLQLETQGTGRLIIDVLDIEYCLSTYIVNSSIINSSAISVKCYDSRPTLINSTISGKITDFDLRENSQPVVLNTTFNSSKLSFLDKESNLTVQNYLHVRVENLTGEPLDANVQVLDNNKTIVNTNTGANGEIAWITITYCKHNITGIHENQTIASTILRKNIFSQNPRTLNMSDSHWEIFATDSEGPKISNAFPEPFSIVSNTRNVISAQITDPDGFNISTIKLYLWGFAVPFSLAPIPDGYNISYQINIPEGTSVSCRIKAEDIRGNIIDYSWEFYIGFGAESFSMELQAGWNLISIPLEMYNNSVEAVLNSIQGKYHRVKAYSRISEDGPWLTYSPESSDSVNSLKFIDRNMGFWVEANEDCTLEICGTRVESTNIPLYAGWNLVGYPVMDKNQTIDTALIGTDADRIEGIDLASPYLINVLQPEYIMKAGEGYWIHVPADTVWVVS